MQKDAIEKDVVNENDTNIDYINALEEQRKNTVSKSDYDKLVQERKELINRLAKGDYDKQDTKVEPKDLNELRKFINRDTNISNLEYCKKALELRNELISQGHEDPFVPQGHQISATNEDREIAQRVADGLQHCIDVAEGNSDIFTNELTRITKDVIIRKK